MNNDFKIAIGRALALLHELLDEVSKLERPNEDSRAVFVYRHARNILSLGLDAVFLLKANRGDSCAMILRVMLEGLFKLGAGANEEKVAISIMVYEIEEEIKKIGYLASSGPDFARELAEGCRTLKQYMEELRDQYSLRKGEKWQVYRCAASAGLPHNYRHDYYLLSKHIHATTSGIIQQEVGIDALWLTKTLLFILIATTGKAAAALRVDNAQRFVDRAELLLSDFEVLFVATKEKEKEA